MRRFTNGCGVHRANLRLLAGGALTDRERAVAEEHLAGCVNCRHYYDEVKRVAASLAGWENICSTVEVTPELEARWAKDFSAATTSVPPSRFVPVVSVLDWMHAMFWPCRRIWTGFGVVWLAIFAVNLSTRERAATPAMSASRPSPEMVRAFLSGETFLTGWPRPDNDHPAGPPKPTPPPRRSGRQPRNFQG